ncbi:substrate-binding periplasmic protein [Gilvimarinus polysaccharolyticus]|uniref:substrate-binding periplasmic protein n=1 Tax=Gilvimarinus polysaccharolyticus TaxID=863921 RepID=UPI0006739039|nr:transporter substrate-binding domain-containing protein [Gilvimarinus polysaccharolyticus]
MYRLLILITVLGGISISCLSYANTVKVCYDQWPPMTIFPADESAERGFVIDMLEQIYTAQGYTLEYYEVPLARGLDMVAEGLCDMLPEYLLSQSAEQTFVYASEKTFEYASAFVIRRNDSWRYSGVQSLNHKRIATGPGWDYSSMSVNYQNHLDDPKNSHLIEIIAGYDDVVDRILQMIIDHRVDVYADSELVLQHVLNRLNLNEKLQIVRPGLEHKLVEIPIFSKKIPSKKRQQLIKIWNEGRQLIKGQQENDLLQKYNVTLSE